MKKYLPAQMVLFPLLIIFVIETKAQTYVTIPDSNFATWLNSNYPSCMNGNQMDITCNGIVNEDSIDLSFGTMGYIKNLSGIENFTNLSYLDFSNNHVSTWSNLPSSLIYLNCGYNWFSALPPLPPNLKKLYCYGNNLTNLPSLPLNLLLLYCAKNPLTGLPNLPPTLNFLYCYECQLTTLPNLPSTLIGIECFKNQLTLLPSLPAGLGTLYCYNNFLTSLPPLPTFLAYFDCRNNNISCFPEFPSFYSFQCDISGNPFTCLPNYVEAMDAATLAYPLCINGDAVNNPNSCPGADGIAGYTIKDINSNCVNDSADSGLVNIPVQLFDVNNNFLKKVFSLSNSIYNFPEPAGNYSVEVDTSGMPFIVQCLYPGIDTNVSLSLSNPLAENVDFEFSCKPGFDVGTQSIIHTGWVFPGELHQLKIIAGDLSKWYHLNCTGTAGLSGQVQIIVTGPVNYSGITPGALSPSVAGNVFTYSIADYSLGDVMNDFGLIFQTNPTAQAGDFICVAVTVTPSAGDNNIVNNVFQLCYQVENSYDPNGKEVFPVEVLPGYLDYFTYTIHFQNTGNAPAKNIFLADTLDGNLDPETFKVTGYSHNNSITMDSNIVRFRFNNIMLPDSASDEPGSKGYIQFRVKPKSGLPLGAKIENTAYIYFDFNSPVITNTAKSEFVQTISTSEFFEKPEYSVFPNPFTESFQIIPFKKTGNQYKIEMFNILGEKVFSPGEFPGLEKIIINVPAGIYFVKIITETGIWNNKLIRE